MQKKYDRWVKSQSLSQFGEYARHFFFAFLEMSSTPPRSTQKSKLISLNGPSRAIKRLAFRNPYEEKEDSLNYVKKFCTIPFVQGYEASIPPIVSSSFDFIETIGNGSFASVHLVKFQGKQYALKKQYYSPRYTWRLQMSNHWNVLKSLQSHKFPLDFPGLVPMYLAWCEIDRKTQSEGHKYPEVCCFLMEYCPEGSLENIRLSESSVWKLIYDISRALLKMFLINILHNDIKPANILVSSLSREATTAQDSYLFRLADFSNMIRLNNVNLSSEIVEGDGHFLAPEMLSFNTPISAAVDIFALGRTVYYVLVGQYFSSESQVHIMESNLQKIGISTELNNTIQWMCDNEANARPSASALVSISSRQIFKA